MSPEPNALGKLLQQRREALGYSRARLADAVGIKAGTIEGWEIGRVAKPPIHDVLRLARFLGLSAAEIETAVLERSDPAPRPGNNSDPSNGAVPLLEQAIALFGWTNEQAAAALHTSAAQVQSWRAGSTPMALPELMTVAALLGLHAAGATGSGTRVSDVAGELARARATGRRH